MRRAEQTRAVIEMDEATGDLVKTDPSRGNRALLLYVKERGRWRLVSAEMWSANADRWASPALASSAR